MPAGRRHHDRRFDPRAEQGHAGVDLDDVAQHARAQLELPPRRDVLLRGDLVVGAGVAEHPRFRPHHPPRVLLQRIEIDAVHQHSPYPLRPAAITPVHVHRSPKCAVPARDAVAGLASPHRREFSMPSARPSTADKRRTFRKLHKSGCFVIPNPWNVGSARYLQGLGFKALATTSSGHAHSQGYPDGARRMDEVLAHYRELADGDRRPAQRRFRERLRRRSGRGRRERDALHRDRRRRAVDRGFTGNRDDAALRVRRWRWRASRRRARRSTRPAATWCSPRAPKASSAAGPTSTRPSGGSRRSPTPAPTASIRRASRPASRSRRP